MLRKRTLQVCLGWMVLAGTTASLYGQSTAMLSAPPSTTLPFPLDEVHPGLRGTAFTVFEGVRPEPMEVEILGRLKNALGPGRDLILGRLHGTRPEYTGVVAGMSGSPVYVDGKLLGALSYRIGQFSKEPIAGITPIAQMLEVSQDGGSQPAFAQTVQNSADSGRVELQAIEAPLVFSGFSEETVSRFSSSFRALGLVPVAGLGAMDATRRQDEPLVPGSAVSAVLVSGDLSITGTCTVSWIEKDKLLACGHPLTQSGKINLPMAKAEVLATLASPLNAFKIVNATEIIGAFTEDRSSAIFGRTGATAAMIPLTLHLAAQGARCGEKTMHISVANHRELTPQLMAASIYQALQQIESGSSETSYKVSGEIAFTPAGLNPTRSQEPTSVRLHDWASPGGFNSGSATAALAIADRFTQIFSNSREQPQILRVELEVESSDRRRTAALQTALLEATEAHPGDLLQVQAVLQPYQREEQILHASVRVPRAAQPGTYRVLISDGSTLDRLAQLSSAHSSGLADTALRLNALHPNDRVYISLLDLAAQAVLESASLNEVPLSMANVLEPLRGAQRVRLSSESVVPLGSIPAEDEVQGSKVLSLTIR